MDLRAITAAAAIGVGAWSGTPEWIALTAVVPRLVFAQPSPGTGYLVALAYYAATNWPLIPGVRGFYGSGGAGMLGVTYWAAASLLQAIPWATRSRLSYVLGVIPPFGIIGWASPLTAAGVLFPGWSWFGLAALIGLPVRWAVALALIANVTYRGDPPPPASWEGIDTEFGRTSDPADPRAEFAAAEEVQRIAAASTKRVIVFPEFVIPRWNNATEHFWQPTVDGARAAGKTLLVGAGLNGNRNAVLILGSAATEPFEQRIPVPVIMRNTPLNITGPGVVEIAGERVAVLICYEQLLAWPILHSVLQRPTLIVGLANDYWARGTPIPASQRAAVTAWARLFRLPKVMAVNQ